MIIYYDNIVLYSDNMEEHVEYLMIVFQTLKKNNLYVKKKSVTLNNKIWIS